uniref:Innexin n=1 Tax=Macrostomum lignano TaxID=282301 RepID=A0A1I8F826_9PLAT
QQRTAAQKRQTRLVHFLRGAPPTSGASQGQLDSLHQPSGAIHPASLPVTSLVSGVNRNQHQSKPGGGNYSAFSEASSTAVAGAPAASGGPLGASDEEMIDLTPGQDNPFFVTRSGPNLRLCRSTGARPPLLWEILAAAAGGPAAAGRLCGSGGANPIDARAAAGLAEGHYNDFETIDWLKDIGRHRKRRHREILRRDEAELSRQAGVAVRQLFWLAVRLVAGVVDIGTTWMSDLRDGICAEAFWFNKEQCCWSSNDTTFDDEQACRQVRLVVGDVHLGGASWRSNKDFGAYIFKYLLYILWSLLFALLAALLVKVFAPYPAALWHPGDEDHPIRYGRNEAKKREVLSAAAAAASVAASVLKLVNPFGNDSPGAVLCGVPVTWSVIEIARSSCSSYRRPVRRAGFIRANVDEHSRLIKLLFSKCGPEDEAELCDYKWNSTNDYSGSAPAGPGIYSDH